ncbi:hypothetical protein [Kocuria sp. CPCC 205263]|uniref:hypothetical protein n=1 Tax=Kocuria sp. CPCC 205263 TaxID=3073555 RepID=UPI0034D57E14
MNNVIISRTRIVPGLTAPRISDTDRVIRVLAHNEPFRGRGVVYSLAILDGDDHRAMLPAAGALPADGLDELYFNPDMRPARWVGFHRIPAGAAILPRLRLLHYLAHSTGEYMTGASGRAVWTWSPWTVGRGDHTAPAVVTVDLDAVDVLELVANGGAR